MAEYLLIIAFVVGGFAVWFGIRTTLLPRARRPSTPTSERVVIDAAFIAAGRPTRAVFEALSGEPAANRTLRLLDIDDNVCGKLVNGELFAEHGFETETIPAYFYPNQTEPVHTIKWDTYLLCRADLADRDARVILNAIFSNIGRLLEAHTKAEDIKLVRAFSEWTTTKDVFDFKVPGNNGTPLKLHDGARDFLDEKRDTLFIATGSLLGKSATTA